MFDILSALLSVVLYVLQALGLQTIAKRRGIRHGWLAWLPLGDLWILACIADDYAGRTGAKWKRLRIPTVLLAAVAMILAVVLLVGTFFTVQLTAGQVLTQEEMLTLFGLELSDSVSGLYDSGEALTREEVMDKAAEQMSDEQALLLFVGMMFCLAGTMVMMPVQLCAVAAEYFCLYRLFESCDPATKFMNMIFAILGARSLAIFFCRNKDLGLPEKTC